MRPVTGGPPPATHPYPYVNLTMGPGNQVTFAGGAAGTANAARYNIGGPPYNIAVDNLLLAMLGVAKGGNYPNGTIPPLKKKFNDNLQSLLAAEYGRAKGGLVALLGDYCSYCEQRLPPGYLAVEHRIPKAKFPTHYLFWDNFLLGCRNCNSKKGSKPVRADARLYTVAQAAAQAYPLANAPSPGSLAAADATTAQGAIQAAYNALGLVLTPAALTAAARTAAAARIGINAANGALGAGGSAATAGAAAQAAGAPAGAPANAVGNAAWAAAQNTADAVVIAPANPLIAESALDDGLINYYFWPDVNNDCHKRMNWLFARLNGANPGLIPVNDMRSTNIQWRDVVNNQLHLDLWNSVTAALELNISVEVTLTVSAVGGYAQNKRTVDWLALGESSTNTNQRPLERTNAWFTAMIALNAALSGLSGTKANKTTQFDRAFAGILRTAKFSGFYCTVYYFLKQIPYPNHLINNPNLYPELGARFLHDTNPANNNDATQTFPGTNYTGFP